NPLKDNVSLKKIKVLGLGGSGCNTISRLSALNLDSAELIAANTDSFSLSNCRAEKTILLGQNTTFGHGAGGDLQMGRKAAEESYRTIIECIQGSDLLFLTAGLGGGTGSGAIEIAARIAASLGILTISIVTLPFSFEAERRKTSAYEATIELQPFTNTLITIPNDRLVELTALNTPINTTLGMSDDILIKSIQGLSEILSNQGVMNIDFSHISKLMRSNGGTFISIGFGTGRERVASAIQEALAHPLLEPTPIHQAQGIIVKLTGDTRIEEIDSATAFLKEKAPEGVEILPVIEQKNYTDDQIMVSLILTGMGATPVQYPEEIVTESIKIHNKNEVPEIHENNPLYSKSLQNYDDELEVPAFLRRGYNLANQFK
ncbi:MAG: cell division protein FtsZ, partial [Pelolinea sp.]|nr:cell division protein FtsZ [Pelolinea sp.]